jgi:hypothetical protein
VSETPARWKGRVDQAFIGYWWTLSEHGEPGDLGLPMDVASGWRLTAASAARAAIKAAGRRLRAEKPLRITSITIKDER